jgi:outer membrane protein OmpA-like peptidoglycan-associated protein
MDVNLSSIARASVRPLVALLVASLLAAAPACTKPPRPDELQELDRLWSRPEARKVKEIPGAQQYYEEAYDLRLRARQEYNDGNIELSREYAIWSMLKYRTAESLAKQFEAKERLEASNAKIREVNPKLIAVNKERNKLQREVSELERKVAVARRRKEDRERRAAALARRSSTDTGGTTGDSAMRRSLNDKLEAADEARSKAKSVEASRFAPETFNQAANKIKSIKTMLSSGQDASSEMLASADQAVALFEKSYKEAKPEFEEYKRKQNPALRNANLFKLAKEQFGADYVSRETNGVRIIMTSLFTSQSSDFAVGTDSMLSAAAKLAKKYDEYDLVIEGYTSKKGGATENLTLSQSRAFAVKKKLSAAGVDSSRIETKGKGETLLRYKDDDSKNDRVELLFRRP